MFSSCPYTSADLAIAIGYSTNLISKDANLIIVRGGSDPLVVYEQMKKAVSEFFPDEHILDNPAVHPDEPSTPSRRAIPLRKMSGMSATSLVPEGNGSRPGGFVLVIDGGALVHVSLPHDVTQGKFLNYTFF